jgi:5,10-methylenetetrahydromethanopterin reductase
MTDGDAAGDRAAGDGVADQGDAGVVRGIELTPEVPVSRAGELAAVAEAEGFDAVFASCHYNNRDPFAALTRMAAETGTVALGPGVANPYDVHPVKLAAQVATLAETSDGRAHLGLGAGDASTLSNLGVDRDRPLRRVLEAFKVAQRLWDGERVDHDGTFTARDAGLNFEPPGSVPVYVGAQGPDMLRMAGKHADGALVNGAHPRDLAWASDRIAEGTVDRPEDRGPVETLAFASVSVAEDRELARDAARRPVSFIVAGAPPPVLDRHGLDHDRADEIGDAIQAGEFGRADGLVTEQMVDAFAAAGDVDAVAERLAGLLEHADGVVAAAPLGPDRERAIELAGAALARASR